MQKFSPLLFIQASLYGSLRTIYKEKKKKKTNRPSKQAANPDDLYYKAKNTEKDPWILCIFVCCTFLKFKNIYLKL